MERVPVPLKKQEIKRPGNEAGMLWGRCDEGWIAELLSELNAEE